MDCNRAREGLWPPEKPKLHGDEVAAARAHVEGCAECRAYFEQDRVLLESYDRLRRQPVPRHVRERVFDALAGERWVERGRASRDGEKAAPGARSWILWPLAVAAAAALITFSGIGRGTPPTEVADDGAMFVEDYLRRAVGQDHIVTKDPDEVRRFLARELGMQLRPIALDGLELERAEICLLEGRRGAMIVYKRDGAQIAHYLVPREGTRPRRPAVSDQAGGPGMPVVTWSTAELEQALVGEVAAEQLLAIAGSGSGD